MAEFSNSTQLLAGNCGKGVDILIFNSWHWWLHTARKQPEWGESRAKHCGGQSRPVPGGSRYPGGENPTQKVVEEVLQSVSKPVHLLNITALSQLRKDGHLSVYGFHGHIGMDCSHWCLLGVPDTWKHLLYAALLQA